MGDHQGRAAGAGSRDHRVALRDREGHRLLDQDMLPGVQERDRLLGVQRVRRRDDDRVQVVPRRERPPVRRDLGDLVAFRQRVRALLSVVRDREELTARIGEDAARMEVLDPSGSDQRHPHGAYPFTPVSVTPSMNAFWAIRNRMITGSMNTTDAAICRFHRTPLWTVVKCCRPTERVQMLSLFDE